MSKFNSLAVLVGAVVVLNGSFVQTSFAQNSSLFTVGGTQVTDRDVISATFAIDDHCSGFMIAPNFGITAHHCDAKAGSVIALLGGRCTVTAAEDAPNADPNYQSGDFTLVKVSCPAEIAAAIKPFELPAQGEVTTGTVAITGYGGPDGSSLVYPNLFAVPAAVTTDYTAIENRCTEELRDYPAIMAGARAGMGICFLEATGHIGYYGDSGGPVLAKTATGYQVVAVNSLVLATQWDSNGIAVPNGVLGMCDPRLAYYSNWIKSQMAR